MTCYFRHLNEIFQKAGIIVTKENKRELDKVLHQLVKVRYKDCPQAWRDIRVRIAEDEKGFVAQLKAAWIQNQKGHV